jgi:hypothetical protein
MPPLTIIVPIAQAVFAAKGLKLPTTNWKQPAGKDAEHYARVLANDTKIPSVDAGIPMFMPQNPTNMHHADAIATIGDGWRKFITNVCKAIEFAFNLQFRGQACFKSWMINGPTALGMPGCLDAPDIDSSIKTAPSVAEYTNAPGKAHVAAVAKGFNESVKKWKQMVTCPGLPLYPAFAAFPGPMAPPMPNVPMPLIAMISGMMSAVMMPMLIKTEMVNALDGGVKQDDKDKQYDAAYEGIATAVAMAFTMWMPQQQVMLVLGKGQIPTFAPPYVPVGPVLAGDIISVPGHLIA